MAKKIKTVSADKIKHDIDPPEEIRALRSALADADARLEEYKTEHGTIKGMMRDISETIQALPAPTIIYKKPDSSMVESPVALVVLNGDWHMGAEQDKDEIEGFNEFSPEILDSRITNFTTDVLNCNENHKKSYDVDICHIINTGDMVSGDIHDELRVTNRWPLPVQAVEAARLFAKEISLFAPHFRKVVVDMITADNHGRLTKKPQHKEGGFNSINYPLAVIAQTLLKDHENVTFNIHAKEQQSITVNGRRYLIIHGHQVRGWMGIPFYGFERKVGREATKRMRADIAKFDRILAGHYHTPYSFPLYWGGGSASGTDAYDHSQGRDSEPSQSSWFVHPKHGEFDRTNWLLKE